MISLKVWHLEQAKKRFKTMQFITRNPKTYLDKIGAIAFRDVIKHFREERGPDGKWEPILLDTGRTGKQRKRNAKTKKSPKILQDTGLLRVSTRWRTEGNDVVIYNGVKYADYHQQQHKQYDIPQRKFLWISSQAGMAIAKTILKSIVGK